MTRRVTILGATGSIGQNTIDLIARDQGRFSVVALTGGQNIARLAADARALRAELAVTADPALLGPLREALAGSDVEAAAGPEALVEAARRPADWIMSAIVGAAGLQPGLAALEQGTVLALANKETLVTAGPLVMRTAAAHGATILPVDSEHSAVFQAMLGEDMSSVERIILTASGGAFRDWPLEQLPEATLAQASTHPNWDMGQRITIDSASMFNKALEVIEAKEFFDIAPERIEVLIHPESMIHAVVGHIDGGMLAHLGAPDMRHAIGYALNHPERAPLPVERLELAKLGQLTFRAPDPARYPALDLARQVMARGGLSGAVFNAAKEKALDLFIAGQVRFTEMADLVKFALDQADTHSGLIDAEISLDNILKADHFARCQAEAAMAQRQR
ncbi:1-deoxy-D-xylulose-5-phosphate reductoisomerase [Pseudooceanicola atlanticus]|uniref:1-deoxy-D-xylulose 5-phosphate reductoisomerase n=1 Tax=Pseudooceanicola atlanticus TaxID=1461694 RepID=A0A0A0E9E2_9RHOB|nr:1-deoxy-D-xylulose-5-phosphate reductoisomerase [Pseudooceanicola atlanticus]KGM46800.1 1-deoxy-D-xylulose 5-phosphate reductoisomerase [Pseudooceanicola atlanticus]